MTAGPLTWLLGLLPAWWLSFGAGWIAAGGLAATLYGLFTLAPYRNLAQIAGVLAIGAAGFLAGVGAERAQSETDELKTQIAELEQRLEFMDQLAEQERVRATEEAALRTLTQGRLDALLQDDADEVQADIAAAGAAAAAGAPVPPPPPGSRRLGKRAQRLCELSGAVCRD